MRKFLLFLIIFVIFIVGCKNGDEPTTGKLFIGGSSGLDISFIEDEPPGIVLDNSQEEFFITLQLENKGEFTIPAGKIIATLKGIDKNAFSLSSLTIKSNSELEGNIKIRDQQVRGSVDELSFGLAKYKNDLPADFFVDLSANVCYQYRTKSLSNDFCLKKKASDVSNEGCEVDHRLDLENSGAPVEVSLMDEKPSGQNQVRLIFDITKRGAGTVFSPNAFSSSCGTNNLDEDKIKVTVTSPGLNLRVDCPALGGGSSGETRLIDGIEKTVICKIDTTGLQEEAFTAPLEVQLDYFYKDLVTQSLTVENSDF